MSVCGISTTFDILLARWLHLYTSTAFKVFCAGFVLLEVVFCAQGFALWQSGRRTPLEAFALPLDLLYMPPFMLGLAAWKVLFQFRGVIQLPDPQPFELEVTSSGVRDLHRLDEHVVPWGAFHHFRESRTLFLLYDSRTDYRVIPKRDLDSPGDVSNLRTLLQAGLDGSSAAGGEAPPRSQR